MASRRTLLEDPSQGRSPVLIGCDTLLHQMHRRVEDAQTPRRTSSYGPSSVVSRHIVIVSHCRPIAIV
jgi:hypothetical protein